MATTRAKQDIDWQVGGPPSFPAGLSRAWQDSQTNFSNPATADINKLGIIVIAIEDDGGGTAVSSVTVGAQPATEITRAFEITTFSNEISIFYLTDLQLQALGTNDAITVNYSAGAPPDSNIATVIYSNIDQSNPVVGSDNFNTTTDTTDTLTSAADSDGVSIIGLLSGTSGNTITASGFTQVANLDSTTQQEGDVFQLLTSGTNPVTSTWTISNTLRSVGFLVNLRSQ